MSILGGPFFLPFSSRVYDDIEILETKRVDGLGVDVLVAVLSGLRKDAPPGYCSVATILKSRQQIIAF